MKAVVPGLAWTTSVALVAWLLSHVVPLLGAPVLAILIGLTIATARRPAAVAEPGIHFSSTVLLQAAIALLGTGIGLGQVLRVGARSLPVMFGTLAVALAGAYVVGRLLEVSPRMRTLVGVGTGICGASAIAAVSRVIGATSTEITYAISAIFLFNVAAVALFPVVGHFLHMSQHGFGLWAGTAVNDTSSVVAVGYAFGSTAGQHAVVVKLTRTTLIVPIVLGLAAWRARTEPGDETGAVRARSLVPLFIVLFVLAAALNTVGAIGAGLHRPLSDAALALTTVALAGVGLSSDLGAMRRTGLRPVVLAAILWVCVASVSLLLQTATGQR
jgi:uncharacterized integral membrane protein (TIGR00698 family)